MATPPPLDTVELGEPRQDESVGDLFARLRESGTAFVQAEIAYYRASLGERAGIARGGAILLIGAVFLLQATLTALLVGLIAVLRAPLGPGGATAIVVGIALLLCALLGWLGVARLTRAMKAQDKP